MTTKLFEECAYEMSKRSTIFAGGYIELNSKQRIRHVQQLAFDLKNETVHAVYWDLDDRHFIQKGMREWVNSGKTVKTFPFPVKIECIKRTAIRKIYYPYRYFESLLC